MKTVLITGCSSGFGRSLVDAYLQRGDYVIATLRNASSRPEVFKGILENQKTRLKILSLDVTNKKEIEDVCLYIEKEHNAQLDVLINNAGYGLYGALEDVSEEQIRHQMEVNFFGPTLLTQATLPFLRATKGKVINISSLMARFSLPLGSLYSASKYALEGLSEGLYYELRPHGVSLSTIQPGGHRTSFTKSICWGESSGTSDSPYTPVTKAFKTMMTKLTSRPKAPDATKVVQAALKITDSKRPPRCLLIGKDATSTGLMQKLLPVHIYHALLTFFYSRMIQKNEVAQS